MGVVVRNTIEPQPEELVLEIKPWLLGSIQLASSSITLVQLLYALASPSRGWTHIESIELQIRLLFPICSIGLEGVQVCHFARLSEPRIRNKIL